MIKVALMVIIAFSISCARVESIKKGIDYNSFGWSGGTVFSEPSIVTTKEVHFDTGNLLGNEIIIEGRIESLGKYDTHLVISDDSGRMLVVLTHIEDADKVVTGQLHKKVRVLGSIERGKKGLPYVLAKSLNLVKVEH